MTSHVRIGDNRIFTLKQAVLLYQDGNTTFATLHEVKSPHEGAPYLGAGQSVTTGFLEKLARGLGASLAPEVLPPNILSRTPELIVWWSPEKNRLMFFGAGHKDTRELNGRMYPHPALVFMVNGRELLVRALAENRRPTADTRLKRAPYWNTDAHVTRLSWKHARSRRSKRRLSVGLGGCIFCQRIYSSERRCPSDHPPGWFSWTLVKPGRTRSAVSSQVSRRCEPNAAGVCAKTGRTMKLWKRTIFIQNCRSTKYVCWWWAVAETGVRWRPVCRTCIRPSSHTATRKVSTSLCWMQT